MAVTDAERHHLYEVLKSHLGAASADTLMNLIPPAGWADLATKADLAATKADLSAEIAGLRGEMTAGFAEVRTEIAEVRGELKAEIAGLRADIAEDLASVRSDLLRTFGTWLFASQAGVIAAVAVLFSILR